MNPRSPLRRFATVSRDFGIGVAIRVAYSGLRGRLYPALALPDAPIYEAGHRQLSMLVSTAEQGAATLDGIAEILAGRGGAEWEVCVCERSPAPPEIERALARCRRSRPRVRIVTTDASIDAATAARWTVEQATGRYVALMAPQYEPEAEAIARLLARLHAEPGTDAAALVGTGPGAGRPPAPVPPAGVVLLVQRKSAYLAAFPDRWPLTVAAAIQHLAEAGVPTAYLGAGED